MGGEGGEGKGGGKACGSGVDSLGPRKSESDASLGVAGLLPAALGFQVTMLVITAVHMWGEETFEDAMSAPCSARHMAVPRPMPRDAPVISATLPSSFI